MLMYWIEHNGELLFTVGKSSPLASVVINTGESCPNGYSQQATDGEIAELRLASGRGDDWYATTQGANAVVSYAKSEDFAW